MPATLLIRQAAGMHALELPRAKVGGSAVGANRQAFGSATQPPKGGSTARRGMQQQPCRIHSRAVAARTRRGGLMGSGATYQEHRMLMATWRR